MENSLTAQNVASFSKTIPNRLHKVPLSAVLKNIPTRYFTFCQNTIQYNPNYIYEINNEEEDIIPILKRIPLKLKVHSWKHIKSLYVDLGDDSTVAADWKTYLPQIIKRLRNLRSISMNFESLDKWEETFHEVLLEMRQTLACLKNIVITLGYFKTEKEDKLKGFDNYIKQNCKDLRNLEMIDPYIYDSSTIISTNKILLKSAKYLPHLQKTTFTSLWEENITKESLNQLNSSLRQIKNVRFLNINFDSISEKPEQGIQDIMLRIGKNLKNLTNIKFDFKDCEFLNDEEFMGLGTALCLHLKSLQSLELNFRTGNIPISDVAIKDFFIQIEANLTYLQHLSIYFYHCSQVTATSLQEIALHVPHLKTLSLTIRENYNITDQGIQEFVNLFESKLKNVQDLHLKFEICPYLTDKGVESLLSSIASKLPSICTLKFFIENCGLVTDSSLGSIANNISHKQLPYLREFHFGIRARKKISDAGLEVLGNGLASNLRDLKYLHMDLSLCQEITDEGFLFLISLISKSLKNLFEFTIIHYNSSVSTEGSIAARKEIETNLPQLDYFKISRY